MNYDLLKQHVSEIEYCCSMIRLATFAPNESSSDKVWSNATSIMAHSQQLQRESGESITKPVTAKEYDKWDLMLRFNYGFTHKEKHAFKAFDKLIQDNPTAPSAFLQKLITEHIDTLKNSEDSDYVRIVAEQLNEYTIVFRTKYGLLIATLERRLKNG